MSTNDNLDWKEIETQLYGLNSADLIALVKDLFDRDAGTQKFLVARFATGDEYTVALDNYRRQIIAQFYTDWGPGPCDAALARRVIRDYQTAAHDTNGVAELLLTLVETGTRFVCDHGAMGERLATNLLGALSDLVALLETPEGVPLLEQFRPRLRSVLEQPTGAGYGYDEDKADIIYNLEGMFDEDDLMG